MMLKFIKDKHPSHILICYDSPNVDAHRKTIYPEYKKGRTSNNAISAQELIIRKMLTELGMHGLMVPKFEADDIIASAAIQFKDEIDVVIMSGDKDLLQLVGPTVRMYDGTKKKWFDDADIQKKFGVRPDQISEYLAIVGDKADDIPGAQGIGPVGAQSLLKAYDTIDGIYSNIDSVTGTMHKKLIKSRDLVYTCSKLTHLYNDIELGVNLDDLKFTPQINDELTGLLTRLEFTGFDSKLTQVWRAYR